MPSPTVSPSTRTSRLSQCALDRLRRHRADPSVSVLLTTSPAATLCASDVVRLHRLIDQAERRLAVEATPGQARGLTSVLRELAVDVRRMPARRGLALFASERHVEVIHLPTAVGERVVVDPTFATRDLVGSLHATPRIRILVLSRSRTRLLEGDSFDMHEVTAEGFPIVGSRSSRDRASRFGRDRSDERDSFLIAHIRAAETAVAARRVEEPLPLVVAGVSRQRAMFRARSTESATVIGEISGSHERSTPSQLARLAEPVIEAHLRHRADAALARLDDGRRRGRTLAGVDAVWKAATEGRVGLLCVEEGFMLPARLTDDGRRLQPTASHEGVGILDDSIDELIELVLAGDAAVVLVEDGRLTAQQRVAALVS